MNRVILMGRLTADPDLRYTTNSNIPVCRFSLAVDRPYQRQGEERQADFFRIVAWRSTAEFACRYFKKGMRVLVEGTLRNNDYDDNQGVRHYSVDVQADRLYFADGKRDDAQSGGGFSQQPSYRTPAQQDASAKQPEPGDGFFPLSDDDDDLPF